MNRVRQLPNNQVIYDQADFYQNNAYDRVTGILSSQVQAKLFFNNLPQPISVVDGIAVTDALVNVGSVFWYEVGGNAGYYAIRWRPSAVGYWRLVLNYPTTSQTLVLDYDIFADSSATASSATGLRASFNRG